MKFLITVALCLLGTTSYSLTSTTRIGGVTIPNQSSPKALSNKAVIENLYHWLNEACKDPKRLSQAEAKKYFSNSVQYSVNGKLAAQNLEELVKRFQLLIKNNHPIQVVLPLNYLISTDNMAAFNYRLNITNKKGFRITDGVSVIAKLKNGKITSWQAVAAHQN